MGNTEVVERNTVDLTIYRMLVRGTISHCSIYVTSSSSIGPHSMKEVDGSFTVVFFKFFVCFCFCANTCDMKRVSPRFPQK